MRPFVPPEVRACAISDADPQTTHRFYLTTDGPIPSSRRRLDSEVGVPPISWTPRDLVRVGRTPGKLACEFDPSAASIAGWIRRADAEDHTRPDVLHATERDDLARLHRRAFGRAFSARMPSVTTLKSEGVGRCLSSRTSQFSCSERARRIDDDLRIAECSAAHLRRPLSAHQLRHVRDGSVDHRPEGVPASGPRVGPRRDTWPSVIMTETDATDDGLPCPKIRSGIALPDKRRTCSDRCWHQGLERVPEEVMMDIISDIRDRRGTPGKQTSSAPPPLCR